MGFFEDSQERFRSELGAERDKLGLFLAGAGGRVLGVVGVVLIVLAVVFFVVKSL